MIVRRVVRNKDGEIEAQLMLSSEQAAFLINVGLVSLVTAGSAQVQDMTQEEFEAEVAKAKMEQGNSGVTTPSSAAEDKAQKDFLEFVDPESLPKA